MNGWEACKNLTLYFSDEQKLFRNPKHRSLRESQETELAKVSKNETLLRADVCDASNLPYIFAFSCLIDQEIEKKAKKCGFNSCVEGPLTHEKVNKNIIEFIERDRLFKKKQDSFAFDDDALSVKSGNLTHIHQYDQARTSLKI